jgi:hypothetical protein
MQTDFKYLVDYFSKPFPGRKGFSPYRNPGYLVHIPVIACSLLASAFLSTNKAGLLCFSPLFLVVGLYAGRDLAILAHYNPFITIFVLIATVVLPAVLTDGNRLLLAETMYEEYGIGFHAVSISVALLVSALFCLRVGNWIKREKGWQAWREDSGNKPP